PPTTARRLRVGRSYRSYRIRRAEGLTRFPGVPLPPLSTPFGKSRRRPAAWSLTGRARGSTMTVRLAIGITFERNVDGPMIGHRNGLRTPGGWVTERRWDAASRPLTRRWVLPDGA